jgi:hypothetical protein
MDRMKNLVSVLENVVLWMWCVVVGVILGRIWTVVVR